MVLSNKKLKQKLREKFAESLIASVAGQHSNADVSANPEPESLKDLLGAASRQGPRLSKREKRRKSVTSVAADGKSSEEKKEDENQRLGETKRKKKRKRDEGGTETSAGDDGSVVNNEKAKKLKKKKKKKKKKSTKKANNGEEEKAKQGGEGENEVEVLEEPHDNIYSEVNDNVATKVYVGGIPYYSTEDDICSFFETCGTVTEVDCMKFPESGKFRGIAMLSFKTEAAAKRALAMDGADMGGLFLKVQPYKGTRTARKAVDFSPVIVEGYNRIYLGNLSWDVTEEDLKKLFSNCNIASIRFGMDKETGEFRGYAHIDFSDSMSLKTALKLDQEMVQGRPVKIRCAVGNKGTERGAAAAETTHPQPVPAIKEAENGGTERGAAAAAETTRPQPVPAIKEAENGGTERGAAAAETTRPQPVPAIKEAENDGLSAVSGKIRRRTCYECGEKGHLSSNCPKKQLADSVASAVQ